VKDFLEQQTRFKMLTKSKPEDAKRLWAQAQRDAERRFAMYEYLAQRKTESAATDNEPAHVRQAVETGKV
jgi:pyruvate-ferredoxin/flavodoxin oxidoreductase